MSNLLLHAAGAMKTSDSGGREVIDEMLSVTPEDIRVVWNGTDRPEFTDFDGAKVCVEAERTNLYLESDDFTDQDTIANVDVSQDGATRPIGTSNSTRLTSESAGTTNTNIRQNITVANETVYTFSVFAKFVSSQFIAFRFESIGGSAVLQSAWFDLQAGVVGIRGGGITSTQIRNVGGGWYRCIVTYTTASTSEVVRIYPAVDGDGSFDSALNATDFFGAQLEKGSYPTNYIPTSGAPVTRLAPFAKIDRVDIADVFIAFIDDFVFGDQDLQRYAIVRTIDRSFGLFTRDNNRLQFYATTAGGSRLLLDAPLTWQPVNTRKKWFFSIYVKGTEVQIGMGDPETGDLGTVEAVTEGLNTGSHDLYLSGPGAGSEGYSSHRYTAYKNLTGHPKMSVEELKNLMQSIT